MSVAMVGSVALDSVRTPFGEAEDALGGSATHAALAARLLAPVEIIGVVGSDFPKRHINLLKRSGVGIEGLEIVPNGRTFRWGGTYLDDVNQRETRYTELGVFQDFHPKLTDSARRCPFVFLGNIHPELQLQVLGQFRKPKLVILDTMNLWISICRKVLEQAIRRVDAILVNDEEARMFTGERSLARAAEALLKPGPKQAIIKKGEHGCLVFSRRGFFAVPAIPLAKVVDPTGAGDTFAGGFIGYLARLGSTTDSAVRQAAVVGTALASFCVEDFSVRRVAGLKREELRKRIKLVTSAMNCGTIRI